jgi:hypothetical protein
MSDVPITDKLRRDGMRVCIERGETYPPETLIEALDAIDELQSKFELANLFGRLETLTRAENAEADRDWLARLVLENKKDECPLPSEHYYATQCHEKDCIGCILEYAAAKREASKPCNSRTGMCDYYKGPKFCDECRAAQLPFEHERR